MSVLKKKMVLVVLQITEFITTNILVELVTDSNLPPHFIQDKRHISKLCLSLAANSLHQLITGLKTSPPHR